MLYGIDLMKELMAFISMRFTTEEFLTRLLEKLADVRDDQVVSRWDLDTGPTSMLGMFDVNLDRVFKNNKLEADGVLDYAKILVRSPFICVDTAVTAAKSFNSWRLRSG
jgi:hypothetical protein